MRSPTRLCCALAVVALPLVFPAFPSPGAAPAALTVNTLADTLSDGLCADANAVCTLRAAIQRARPDQVIGFSVTGTIHVGQALPELTGNVTIRGPGSGLLTVRRGADAGDFRIFTVRAGAVTVSVTAAAAVTFQPSLHRSCECLPLLRCLHSSRVGDITDAGLRA